MIKNRQSGYILIVVISILSILMVIGLSFAGFAYYGLQRTASVRDSTQAYYAARSGIVQAIQTLSNTGEFQGKLETRITPLSDSSTASVHISAEVSWNQTENSPAVTNNSLTIISHGMVKIDDKIRGERLIQAVTDRSSHKILYITDLPVTSMEKKEH